MYQTIRYLYSLLLVLAIPFILLRLLWRGRRLPAYKRRWAERFGFYPTNSQQYIWVHAVSVGEVVAATPLIKALLTRYSDLPILVTTTTPTGAQRVQQNFNNAVKHVYLPYDLPWAVSGFLRTFKPICFINMETEIWPNLFNACHERNIPIIIANARLAEKSLRGYMRIKWVLERVLDQVTLVAAQSQLDADRYKTLGLNPEKLIVTGNLKYDVQYPIEQQMDGQEYKKTLGKRKVLIAASTHAGEEEQILAVFSKILQQYPDCLLLLVPRHPDRFNQVAELVEQQKFRFMRRSTGQICTPSTQVMLGDSMGEMTFYYSIADLAFLGGSLVPIGGHNLLEPAALGLATVTGAHLHNFTDIAHKLEQNQSIVIVQNTDQLYTVLMQWLENPNLLTQIGTRAKGVVMQNQGSLIKLLKLISPFLERNSLRPLEQSAANY